MKTKLTTYLLLTILFVSQSFASNLMSCEQNDQQSTHTTAPENLHAGHLMLTQMNQGETNQDLLLQSGMSMDCCADDCVCPVGTFASTALLGSLAKSPLLASADKVQFPPHRQPTPYYTPLNKPPIFA
jgi:hypothetical protein